jgi:hypothetical protein
MPNATLDRARAAQTELSLIRRDIHAHPELGMQEPLIWSRASWRNGAWRCTAASA